MKTKIAVAIVLVVIVIFWFWLFSQGKAGEIVGKVVGVHDGDTITVLDKTKKQYKIRLKGIDAPELGQSYGKQAKKELSERVFNKKVVVDWEKTDRYNRIVGDVKQYGSNINYEMVKNGYAWHYKQYARHDKRLADAEEQAKKRGIGLWASKAIPPWEWRRGKR